MNLYPQRAAALLFSALSVTAPLKAQTRPLNVGVLLYKGVQIIDYAAPYEVFSQASRFTKGYNVFTVAERPDSLETSGGPGAARIKPRYSFGDHPPIDILVVPGGGGASPGTGGVGDQLANAPLIAWIRATGQSAQVVLSVCSGALLIGKAQLLEGLSGTTFWGMLDNLQAVSPTTRVVSDQRFVDNGKIITTAGLSSGIDGALHVVDRFSGRGRAEQVALNMEYDWHPRATFVRSALPDMVLWHSGVNYLLLYTLGGQPRALTGDSELFEEVIAIGGAPTPREVMRQIATAAAQDSTWRDRMVDTSRSVADGRWSAISRRGDLVRVAVRVEPGPAGADSTIVRLNLSRAPRPVVEKPFGR
jgi:putative intracellular protease/amidase